MGARLVVGIIGCTLFAGCHDFSEIKPAIDAGGDADADASEETASDAAAEAAPDGRDCSGGMLVKYLDGTQKCQPTPMSCQDLPPLCGPDGGESCCQYSPEIGNDTFARGYDRTIPAQIPDGGITQGNVTIHGARGQSDALALQHAFFLDRYEVTIGRFRRFFNDYQAVLDTYPRGGGVGAYPPGVVENGWSLRWNARNQSSNGSSLLYAASPKELAQLIGRCNADLPIWLGAASSMHDDEPVNCVSWYEAFLFCAWDGGHLPSEAQWNFAAAGGSEKRPYPWVQTNDLNVLDVSPARANIGGIGPGIPMPVGSFPAGQGKWGHEDLAGNVWEYVLDACAGLCDEYTGMGKTAIDPVQLLDPSMGIDNGVVRGGAYETFYSAPYARTAYRLFSARELTAQRVKNLGFRCAREP